MAHSITEFLTRLGTPQRTVYSWSGIAQDETRITFKSYRDEFVYSKREVKLFDPKDGTSQCNTERARHAAAVAEGKAKGTIVIITDWLSKVGGARETKAYKDDAVFPIIGIRFEEDGVAWAIVGAPVKPVFAA